MMNLAIFLITSLTIVVLLLRRMVGRAKDELLTTFSNASNVAKEFKVIVGMDNEKFIRLQESYEKLRIVNQFSKFTVLTSTVISLLIFIYWLLVDQRGEIITLLLATICMAPLAIAIRDGLHMFSSLSNLKALRSVTAEMKERIEKKIVDGMRMEVKLIVTCGGDYDKALTKALIPLKRTLLLLFPSSNSLGEGLRKEEKISPFLSALSDPKLYKMVIDCLKARGEGIFVGEVGGRNLAVVIKNHIAGSSLVMIFENGEVLMRMVIKVVVAGKIDVQEIYRERSSDVSEVISWALRSFEGAIFIVMVPLKGSTGWSIAMRSLEMLKGRPLMTILIYEPPPYDVLGQLSESITEGKEFKVELTRARLAEALKSSPVFIFKNVPSDEFDRNVVTNILAILDSCSTTSFGTTDFPRTITGRERISRCQYMAYHNRVEEGMMGRDEEGIRDKIAKRLEPEVVIAVGSEYPDWVRRKVVSQSLVASGFILCYGLYGIIDNVMKEALEEAMNEIAKRAIKKFKSTGGGDLKEWIKMHELTDRDVSTTAIIGATVFGKPLEDQGITFEEQGKKDSLEDEVRMYKIALHELIGDTQ